MFLVSALLLSLLGCPQFGGVMEFTWLGQAQVQLHILGFATVSLLGAIHEILPRIMGSEVPFKKFVHAQHFLNVFGVALLVIPLAIAGVKQGHAGYDPAAAKLWLMISTSGLLLLLVGSVLLLVNIFVMTIKWKIALAKSAFAAVTAPLESTEVKS